MNTIRKSIVVDDDQDFIESITMILESVGYEMITADSRER